ncbi:MAG TPA: MarR family transcriptional regulator [Candidatus Thermoplasmatota archaeon]|nr:MarR family transcriptional regulator [Candidatus Thermoplasmatota archaeon]
MTDRAHPQPAHKSSLEDDARRRLRDRTAITRLLILGELERRPGTTLSDIANSLGVTVQAVSAHAKDLTALGWLRSDDGTFRATPKGLQSLHEGVRHLRDAVGALAAPLDVIQLTSAVAAASIQAGDAVGLFMEEGDLAARPAKDAPSRGRARNSARPGEEVIVGDLQGMVKLEPGRLTLVSLPGPAEGGIAALDRDALRKMLARRDRRDGAGRMGAHGTGARVLARWLAKEGLARLDFEFAADRAAFNAAERGLDVLLLVTRDRLAEVMDSFERLNSETLRRVPVELVEAPEQKDRA